MNQKEKNPVGRPSKQERKRPLRKGIIKEPEFKENVVEFIYDNPAVFEMILAASQRTVHTYIEIIFETERITIIARDPKKKSQMMVEFTVKNLLSYYSNDTYYYKCNCESLLNIIKAKKKDDDRIMFAIANSNINELKITLSKSTNTIKKTWIALLEPTTEPDLTEINTLYLGMKDYPLSFKLKWVDFKGLVTSWKKFNPNEIYIEKDTENEPFSFHFEYKGIQSKTDFGSDDNIDLKCTATEIFSTKILLQNLTAISSSDGLSKTLYFFVDEEKDLICEAFIDEEFTREKTPIKGTEVAVVKFFTKLL